jgi:hypothetical protein
VLRRDDHRTDIRVLPDRKRDRPRRDRRTVEQARFDRVARAGEADDAKPAVLIGRDGLVEDVVRCRSRVEVGGVRVWPTTIDGWATSFQIRRSPGPTTMRDES